MKQIVFVGFVFCFVAILGVQALTKCQQQQEQGRKEREDIQFADGGFIPECNPDGTYKSSQCIYIMGHRHCYCTDKEGNKLGDKTYPDEC